MSISARWLSWIGGVVLTVSCWGNALSADKPQASQNKADQADARPRVLLIGDSISIG